MKYDTLTEYRVYNSFDPIVRGGSNCGDMGVDTRGKFMEKSKSRRLSLRRYSSASSATPAKLLLGLGMLGMVAAACGSAAPAASSTSSTSGPTELTVGTLYAGSGAFASSSLPQLAGLKFWASQVNQSGGVFVKGLGKKLKVKLVTYNDQSDPTTAATLYNQLITQDHVNVLAADFGSVLTAPAITIAQENHQLLFDQTGTGASFFQSPNPDLVLTALPTSAIWPTPLVEFLLARHIKNIAVVYCANDFDQSQANTVQSLLKAGGVTPVYFQAVPTTTTDYASTIQSIKATNPGAVLELGYANNDIAFLNDLQAAGVKFPMTMTVFPTQLPALLVKDVGAKGLQYTYSYGVPPILQRKTVNFGLTFGQFAQAFNGNSTAPINFPSVAGYTTGLVIQDALAHATSLSQSAIRAGVSAISGSLKTLDGNFQVNSSGAQLGELLPLAQDLPPIGASGSNFQIVYPAAQATASAVYPAP